MTCRAECVSYRLEPYENAGEIIASPFRLHAPFHVSIAPVTAQPVMAAEKSKRQERRTPLTNKPSLAL